jgi:hypothetical protein
MAVVSRKRSPRLLAVISAIAFSAFLGQRSSWADESGVSFWQPGTFANLAAVVGRRGHTPITAADFARCLLMFCALSPVPTETIYGTEQRKKQQNPWQNRTSRRSSRPLLMGQFNQAGRLDDDLMPTRGRESTSPMPRCRNS